MPATLEEVQELIKKEFPGSDVDEVTEENHHITGTIRWDGFEKYDDFSDRLRLVTEKVRDTLGLKGLHVGVLFPLTPGETL